MGKSTVKRLLLFTSIVIAGLIFGVAFGWVYRIITSEPTHIPSLKYPVSLSFISESEDIIPTGQGLGHGQGVTTDGTYIWYSGDNILLKTYTNNLDWTHPLASNYHPTKDGTECDQTNSIHLEGQYIYATAPKSLVTHTFTCFIKWWDKDTLEFVGEAEIWWAGKEIRERSWQEGVDYYDDYWWIVSWSTPWVTKYDKNWNYLDMVNLPKQLSEIQGLEWYQDYLFVARTHGPIKVYHYDGQKFSLISSLKYPPQIREGQGITIDPQGMYLYIASISYEKGSIESNDRLIKYLINWKK